MRLLFHYPVLNRGGAEMSLLRLMAALANEGCEVHLVLTSAGGILEGEVDSRIRIHHLRGSRVRELADSFAPGWLELPVRGLCWLAGRAQESLRRWRFRGITFDAAFTGITGTSPDFICNAVNARRRFVFVRSDPAADRRGRWMAPIRDYHGSVDAYVCVSDYVRSAMASRFPEIAGKLVTIYNLLDPERMRAMANREEDPFPPSDRSVRVLSVCRLQESSKALLRMVEVHRRLLDAGSTHVWHVLGDGPDRALLERSIEAHGVSESFVLHGAIENPFPYYKSADICAVLSRFEGLSGVVSEARVLGLPVIATRFSGIDEQIISGTNGLIVEQDVSAICAGLSALIESATLRQQLGQGGFPPALMDDRTKLDSLFRLIGRGSFAAAALR